MRWSLLAFGALAVACSLDESGGVSDSDAAAGSGGIGAAGGGLPDATSAGGASGDSGSSGGVAGSAAGAAGSAAGVGGSVGGSAGAAAAGGASGAAGAGAAGGTGGTGGTPAINCASYAGSVEFTLPTGQKHCYWLVLSPLPFEAAHQTCAAGGGYLASIHSTQEREHVRALAFGPVPSNGRVWIGATDGLQATATQCTVPYTWISGEPFTFTDWGNQSCFEEIAGCWEHRAVMGNNGTWRTRCELTPFPYVCEAGDLL